MGKAQLMIGLILCLPTVALLLLSGLPMKIGLGLSGLILLVVHLSQLLRELYSRWQPYGLVICMQVLDSFTRGAPELAPAYVQMTYLVTSPPLIPLGLAAGLTLRTFTRRDLA